MAAKTEESLDRATQRYLTLAFRITDCVQQLSFDQRIILRLLAEPRKHRPTRAQIAVLLGLSLREFEEQEAIALRKLRKILQEEQSVMKPRRP